LYRVFFETPAGARGPVKRTHMSYEENAVMAAHMAEAIFEVIKNFAALNTPNRVFQSRKRVIPAGFVLEIFLVGTSAYKPNSGSLYGYIRCEEQPDGRKKSLVRA
jgi:hypothetical protein